MRAYAFLDRDGTLVPERPDGQWAGCRAVELIPGVGAGLRALAGAGLSLVVVTNQYPIGEGLISPHDYADQTATLISAVTDHGVDLLDVLHCPHPRTSPCSCAKPETGMVDEAQRRHGVLDRMRSVVIGDSEIDMRLAAALGIRGFRVQSALLGEPTPSLGLTQVAERLVRTTRPRLI